MNRRCTLALLAGMLAACASVPLSAQVQERSVGETQEPPRRPGFQTQFPPAPKILVQPLPKPVPAAAPSTAPPSTAPTTTPTILPPTTPAAPAPSTVEPAAVRAAAPVTALPPPELLPAANEESDWRPEIYTVKKGDTLYGIALDHGLDHRELAAWNNLGDANLIRIDQTLRLLPPSGWVPAPEPPPAEAPLTKPVTAAMVPEGKPLEAPPVVKREPRALKLRYSDKVWTLAQRDLTAAEQQAKAEEKTPPKLAPAAPPLPPTPFVPPPQSVAAPAPPTPATPQATANNPMPASLAWKPANPSAAKPAAAPATGQPTQGKASENKDGNPAWVWPAQGKLLHAFNQGNNPKGVAIGGRPGEAVMASAAGKVVYSGSGLRGYGKLIIIKHNETYLSVYAHNRELLVKEGERVVKGQKIAEMGATDAAGAGLHFEIRRLGKPVDPLKYLPQERSG